jgi:small nuclear ribonucleoprotein (snRNP)-like protein
MVRDLDRPPVLDFGPFETNLPGLSQLPLGLLSAAQGQPVLVELKNGETLNGHLINCDNWMNLTLKEVVQTSAEGDRFFRVPEVYVRGNNVCLSDRAAIALLQALAAG